MSTDLDVLELLRTEPAPVMHVDLDAVLAEGRRRQTRRAARWLAAGAAAAAAAVVVAVVVQSPSDDRTAPPAGTSTRGGSGVTTGPVETHNPQVTWQPEQPELSGSATLTAPGGSYAVRVAEGVMSVVVTRDGSDADPAKAALRGGGAWRVIEGTSGARVMVGVAPAGATQITYLPVTGESVQPHQVSTAPAGDFTAYLLTFTDPPRAATVAADVGWRFPGDPTQHWTLAIEGLEAQSVGLGVSMAGEAATPLTSDNFTRTGPPTGSSATDSVVVSILRSSPRLGTDVLTQVQADVVVTDADALVATVIGADPEAAAAHGTFQVRGGPSILWGVLPPGATSVTPHLEGDAKAGVPVMQEMPNGSVAFAVMVQGTPDQVTGFDATLGGGRGGISVLK